MGLLPIMGILQGNGMGPFVWAIISSVLLHVMMGQGCAGLLTGVLTGLVLRVVGFSFVDDTDLNHTAKDNTTAATSLLPEFQKTVDCWEGLLRATGGAWIPQKRLSGTSLISNGTAGLGTMPPRRILLR
jgi:hypothetical protein